MFSAPPTLPNTARKVSEAQWWTPQVKTTNFPCEEAKSSVPASSDTYLEIEVFSFNPLDFESFDLPEEYWIAQLPWNGVSHMTPEEERGLGKLLHLDSLCLDDASPPCKSKLGKVSFKCFVGLDLIAMC